MVDFISKEKRSKIMSSIHSKDTSVEINLRRELYKRGFRYRVNYKLKGKPDIVFPSKKLAIFVDGDFWHGYNWEALGKKPPKGFWQEKIVRNMERDRNVNKFLEEEGWTVMRFWEHGINDNLPLVVERVINKLSHLEKN